eukprot:3566-Heterococcus_DN1.PRE.1
MQQAKRKQQARTALGASAAVAVVALTAAALAGSTPPSLLPQAWRAVQQQAAAVHMPKVQLPALSLPKLSLPKLNLPKLELPKVHLPALPHLKASVVCWGDGSQEQRSIAAEAGIRCREWRPCPPAGVCTATDHSQQKLISQACIAGELQECCYPFHVDLKSKDGCVLSKAVAAEVAYELKMLRQDGVKHRCEGATLPVITTLDKSQYIADSATGITATSDDADSAYSSSGSSSGQQLSGVRALLRAGMLKDKFVPLEGSDGTSFTLSEREMARLSLPLGCTLRFVCTAVLELERRACVQTAAGFLGRTAQLLEVSGWCLCTLSCIPSGGALEAQQVLQVCTHSYSAHYSIRLTASHACNGVHCTGALAKAVVDGSCSQQDVLLVLHTLEIHPAQIHDVAMRHLLHNARSRPGVAVPEPHIQAYARDHTELVGVKKGSWGHTAAFDAAWTKIESKLQKEKRMRVEHANYKGQRNVRCWRWMSDDAADSIIPALELEEKPKMWLLTV